MNDKKTIVQPNPLLPGYNFNAYLVAGCTPIEKDGYLDFAINRPNGMKGYIINLTTKGQGTVFQGEQAFQCNVGDLLLFPPNAVHFYHRAETAQRWHHQWIYFRPRAFWQDTLHWSDSVNNVGRLTIPNEQTYQDLLALFQQIEREYNAKEAFSEAMSMCLLEQLLLKCIKLDPAHRQRHLDPRILETCHFIAAHIDKNHKIEEIAAHIHISPSRLTHLFSEQMGTSIVKWREDQRMIKAKHLLHSSVAPIYAIARQLGYDDQLYFSRIFKRYSGLSPSEFRNSR
ncbi:arabinose operon transcriptional regulator AraC [Conservatibacter flavescens]|uniref:Arabinose operon transcriptional regulator AraC n=1 Tax=Conservatibacter flavescens TaxID=28161 RepID=A0A2M8S2H5_9PAST|nr:arabinose operon transcriptional regulator AraC [Conservatibacter flavescens]PJG85335.1 arabinose operon transcriptional regulator AraC [Conservatibacter flavescens]